MQKVEKSFLLFWAAAVLLTVTAFADFGPKPQLVVKIADKPAELYYLDILAEGNFDGADGYPGIQWSYPEEEAAALDQGLLEALRAAVPEGWHACTAEGSTGAPMWGDLAGEDGAHTFGYVGVPSKYRILIVTKSGETWISEVCRREALQSSATVDWMAKTVKTPSVLVGYALQFLATLAPTLLIEGLLLLAFGYPWGENWRAFLGVNLATQGALAIIMSFSIIRSGAGFWPMITFVPIEIAIAVAEAYLFRRMLKGHSKGRAFAYGLTANTASAVAGWFLAEPVWRWIVSIS